MLPMPHLRTIGILDEKAPCMIQTQMAKKDKSNALILSVIQLKKGLKHGDETFLMANREVQGDALGIVSDALAPVLKDFVDMMPAELPRQPPPRREVDHAIELVPGAKPPVMAPYRMALLNLGELMRQLDEMLEGGIIRPSKAPYGTLVLFQLKHDGTSRLCVDYRMLNKVTLKNKYLLSLITNLFDQFGGAWVFSKLDVRSSYWQVMIVEGDEPKSTCITCYRAYEFLMMPFGLNNTPATFSTLMNKIFCPYLDKFVVVYLDDIVIYRSSIEEHVKAHQDHIPSYEEQ
ncbi:unnamed protein product [Victoria cruziana]